MKRYTALLTGMWFNDELDDPDWEPVALPVEFECEPGYECSNATLEDVVSDNAPGWGEYQLENIRETV